MNDELLKKLPFSLVTEQSLLGSIIIDPQTLDEVVQIISPSDFYISEHSEIFTALKELFLNSRDIDFVTLVDALVTKGVYTESAATEYITQLMHKGNNALNVKDYAKIIKDKSVLRQLIDVCDDITEKAYQNYELKTREPKLEILMKIADLYGVSLDYLTGRTNEK